VEEARKERVVAYIFLLVFVAILLWFGRTFASLVPLMMDTTFPVTPLVAGAAILSLATIFPLMSTFRVEAAATLLEKLRAKARRSGKRVTLQTAGRTFSMYTVALAATPMFYGLALIFLVGDFTVMLLLLPATVILAVVGWVVVGRLLEAMRTMFVQ
jgi:hypothetical protein